MNIFKRITVKNYIKEYSLKAEEYLESKGLRYYKKIDINDGVVYIVTFNDGLSLENRFYLGPELLSFANNDSDIHKEFEKGYENFKKSVEVFIYNCTKEKERRKMMIQYRRLFSVLKKELKALTSCDSVTLDYRYGKLFIKYYDKEFSTYLPDSCFKNGEHQVDSVTYDIEKIEDINVKDIVSREKNRIGLAMNFSKLNKIKKLLEEYTGYSVDISYYTNTKILKIDYYDYYMYEFLESHGINTEPWVTGVEYILDTINVENIYNLEVERLKETSNISEPISEEDIKDLADIFK